MGNSVSFLDSLFPHLGGVGYHDLISITFTTVVERETFFLKLGLKKILSEYVDIFVTVVRVQKGVIVSKSPFPLAEDSSWYTWLR